MSEWLSPDPPNLKEARQAVERIIQDGTRPAPCWFVFVRYSKEAPVRDWLDMNEVIQELTAFLRDEAQRDHGTLRTELSADLPKIRGGPGATATGRAQSHHEWHGCNARVPGGRKELLISSQKENAAAILIRVKDCGGGLSGEIAKQIRPVFHNKAARHRHGFVNQSLDH